jgi:DNA-binding GntR family transcriptional regulator
MGRSTGFHAALYAPTSATMTFSRAAPPAIVFPHASLAHGGERAINEHRAIAAAVTKDVEGASQLMSAHSWNRPVAGRVSPAAAR